MSEDIYFTGVDIAFEGRFEVCATCLREAAHELGWVSQEQADAMIEVGLIQETEIADLKEALASASDALKAVAREVALPDEKAWGEGYDEGYSKGSMRAKA